MPAERAITYSPFLRRGLPRNKNGRHRRMLDISCPGVYPGVILWPICHPYIKALAPDPAGGGESVIFFSEWIRTATYFYESKVLVSLPSLMFARPFVG